MNKKLNNKGFAITSFLYAILMVFLVIFSVLLMNMINSKLSINKIKESVKNELEDNFVGVDSYAELIVEEKEVTIKRGADYDLLEGVYLKRYDGEIINTTISYISTPIFDSTKSGIYYINYSAMLEDNIYTNTKKITIPNCVTNPKDNYVYTGESEYIDDGNGNWRIKFYTDGEFKLTETMCDGNAVDAFLVGGGGGGGSGSSGGGGGGGGYTKTETTALTANDSYSVVIGAGGGANASGGSTSFGSISVAGGEAGTGTTGGAGGSGGGGNCGAGWWGPGGTDGSDGGYSWTHAYNPEGWYYDSRTYAGGTGQASLDGYPDNTREFGESTGTLYSGGGGCGSTGKGNPTNKTYEGWSPGNSPGSGRGLRGDSTAGYGYGYSSNTSISTAAATSGVANTGGGGGGGGYTDSGSILAAGSGGSGIVIIRNKR